MNQSAQGDINCPHCECSIRIEGTLKKNTIRCSNCKKIIDDVESRLIPLASTIDLLPSKRPDSQNVNIETLIQENTNQAHIPTEEKAQNNVNDKESSNSEDFANFKSTEELEFDQEFVKKQEALAQEFAVAQSDILNWEEENDGDGTSLNSKKKFIRFIFLAISLIVISLVTYISFKGINKNNAATKGIQLFFESKNTEQDDSQETKFKSFGDLQQTMGAQKLHKSVSEALEKFLNSEDLETKINLSRSSNRVSELMRNHYKNNNDGPIAYRRISLAGEEGTGIIDGFYIIKVSFPDFSILPVVLALEENKIVVDWESFVGYSEMTLKEFISNKPEEPKLFRLHANSDDYFNFQFSEEEYRCLYLRNPEDTKSVYGYIKRGSVADGQLSRIAESGQSIRFLTLKIHYPKKIGGNNQTIIDEIVTSGWLIRE